MPVGFCASFQTGTWCHSSWSLSAVVALPSLSVMVHGAGYDFLRNGIPQGSVLAPLLFNIYMYDLPTTTSRKFVYADDLAIMHLHLNGKL